METSTGEIHYYATPEETPAKMHELVAWYNKVLKNSDFHPIVLASIFHHRFVAIHPFDDGNGRMTRILTNFILLKFGYPVSVIKQETKKEYYANLSQADNGQIIPIIEYISNSVKDSLEIYLKAIAGQDISEPDDLDKEIALFRRELGYKTEVKKHKTITSVLDISFEVFSFLQQKLDKFSDLFYNKVEIIRGDNNSLSFNATNYLSNFDSYKIFLEDKLSNISYLIYEFKLINNIHSEEDIILKIKLYFKRENYIIYFNNDQLIKYYDEKIVDDKYNNQIVKPIIHHLMEEIKRISNK